MVGPIFKVAGTHRAIIMSEAGTRKKQPKYGRGCDPLLTAGRVGLGQWAINIGFSRHLQQKIQAKSLNDMQLAKLKELWNAIKDYKANSIAVLSLSLDKVYLRRGDIYGLPSPIALKALLQVYPLEATAYTCKPQEKRQFQRRQRKGPAATPA